jgi:DUF1365 family protein
MVTIGHQLLSANIYHKRLKPKENSFSYRAFYTILDMQRLKEKNNCLFSTNRISMLSYQHRDHGCRDGTNATEWAKKIFIENNIDVDYIKLITLPRVFGYLFNPVSFWLGYIQKDLCAVICEVNNTFQQTHAYICHKKDKQAISDEDWFYAPKEFHVSPFYPREGSYYFKFDFNDKKKIYAILIHYYINNQLELITSVTGKVKPMTKKKLLFELFRSPLLTLKVTAMIYYQAVKIFFKKSSFHTLPEKKNCPVTVAKNIKNV